MSDYPRHILIDKEGNSWNVSLKIKNNKLLATWDKDLEAEVDIDTSCIQIEEI